MPKRIWLSALAALGLAGLAALMSASLAAAAQYETGGPVRNPRTSPADIAAGAKTFRSHCASCHGLKGDGGRGPNLASGVFFHGSSDVDLLNNISDGIAGTEMPGLFYSPDRVWQIVAFIRSLSAGKQMKLSADTSHGAELFKSKGCNQCHRIRGEGSRLGPDLSEIGRTRSTEHLRVALVDPDADVRQRYWVVSFKGAASAREEGFLMNEDSYTVQFMDMNERLHSLTKAGLTDYKVEKSSKMPSYKDSLTPSEIEHLVAYLSSLRPPGGVP